MKPEYAPKTREQFYGKLIEECGELQAALGKTLCWGEVSTNPELPEDQQEASIVWIRREIDDVEEAIKLFRQNVLSQPSTWAMSVLTEGDSKFAELRAELDRVRAEKAALEATIARVRIVEKWLHSDKPRQTNRADKSREQIAIESAGYVFGVIARKLSAALGESPSADAPQAAPPRVASEADAEIRLLTDAEIESAAAEIAEQERRGLDVIRDWQAARVVTDEDLRMRVGPYTSPSAAEGQPTPTRVATGAEVERVARAIREIDGDEGMHWDYWLPEARAALAAMGFELPSAAEGQDAT